jgi:DNA-binding MarR family transcriptional regulator
MKTRLALATFIEDLIYNVVIAKKHLSDAAEMPDSEYKALRFVHKNGTVHMKDVAQFIGVSMPRATKVADALVAHGYAKRVHGTDRRHVELSLTKKGQDAINKASVMHQDLSEAILAPLTPAERQTMYDLLSKCQQELRK